VLETESIQGLFIFSRYTQEAFERDTLWEPRNRTEMDIDAIWLDENEGVVFLQMTISHNHALQGNRMKELMKQLKLTKAKLWFITPNSIAVDFKRQTIRSVDQMEYQEERNKPQIEQSMAVIDPTEDPQ